jgi:hypothetical protein
MKDVYSSHVTDETGQTNTWSLMQTQIVTYLWIILYDKNYKHDNSAYTWSYVRQLVWLITCEKFGTLAVFRIRGCPWACNSSFTATFCLSRSSVKILSTALTPRVYFSEIYKKKNKLNHKSYRTRITAAEMEFMGWTANYTWMDHKRN